MRFSEIARRGDHIDIRQHDGASQMVHRIERRARDSKPNTKPFDFSETLEFSELTGEPVEVRPVDSTPVSRDWRKRRAKLAQPKMPASYGLNDMDREISASRSKSEKAK